MSKYCGKEKRCTQARPEIAQELAVNQPKTPGEGKELKASWYGYNQGKNQGINLKSQVILLKA